MNMALKRLMDTAMTPNPLHIPDSFAISKRPRNKRKTKKQKSHQNHCITFQAKFPGGPSNPGTTIKRKTQILNQNQKTKEKKE